jgi:hypothetical protein
VKTPCEDCVKRWGQMPGAWGESVDELNAYSEHLKEHIADVSNPRVEIILAASELVSTLLDPTQAWDIALLDFENRIKEVFGDE